MLDVEVKSLLALKANFKKVAGKDWDPKGMKLHYFWKTKVLTPMPKYYGYGIEVSYGIAGNNVAKVESMPELTAMASTNGSSVESLDAQITAQGNKIRELKGQKASKDIIEGEVKALLALKAEFKKVAGRDWDPKGE